MSKAVSFIQSIYSEQNLSFEEMKEKLTSAPYFLVIKESNNWPDLFLLSVSSKTNFSDPEMKDVYNQSMGIIFDKNDYKVVAHSYDRVFELKEKCESSNPDDMEVFMSEEVDHVEIFEEGTFLRVFNYKDKWIVSSLKCIDTTETFIPDANKNFTQLFHEASKDLDLNKWDKKFTYCFILKHPENRCIISYKKNPSLIYVGKCDNENIVQYYGTDFSDLLKESDNNVCHTDNIVDDKETYAMKIIKRKIQELNIQEKNKLWVKSVEFCKKTSISSLLNIIEKRKLNINKGFILYLKDGSRVSLVFKEYSEILSLRGTNPNIKIRYLELDENERKRLSLYFPEYNLTSIDREVEIKAKEIHTMYKAINIDKIMTLEQAGKMKRTIYYLHTYYKQTRHPITLKITSEKLKSLDSKTIAWLLNWI